MYYHFHAVLETTLNKTILPGVGAYNVDIPDEAKPRGNR
jgi:hypothetical protein